ncbi:MAG TPA: cytidylate kinase family protein [Casimicrobiaceae bacterium]|nr:cytidylate kinase family protein [Casimicrobiaceae bacterium]
MTVIAMSQEMGTLGRDVAAGVAKALGLRLVRHEIGDFAAHHMHVKKSLVRRYREGQAGWFEKRQVDESSLALYTADQVFEYALEEDVLIRGWGATILLHPVRHVPCVRICAPLESRIKWLMERLDTDDAELARTEITRSDDAHAARIRHTFGVELGDPLLYDLVLNTGRVSVETCIEQVLALARRPEFQPTAESRAQLADLTLQAHIRTALRERDHEAHIDITPQARNGSVVLRGVVMDDAQAQLAIGVAREVPGVKSVENQLRSIAVSYRYRGSSGPE